MSEKSLKPEAVRARRYTYTKMKKKRRSLYAIAFALLFFIAFQVAVNFYVNLDTVYKHRLNYNLFLKDQEMIEVVVEEMAATIKKKKLNDYIILIGNSVAWGTNESSEHSMGRYLTDISTSSDQEPVQAVFNLSAPSIMAGDAYTLLLMLEEHGIKTDKVMIGLSYSAFSKPNPGPRQVFWLGHQLRKLDPKSFADVLPHLEQNGFKYKTGWKNVEDNIIHATLDQIPMVKYKEVIPASWELKKAGTDLLGDPRAWHEKGFAESFLTDPSYLGFFNPEPFIMDESNWGVYFINRIVEHQEGKRTLFFVSGGNSELSKKEVTNPGYIANLEKASQFLASKGKGTQYLILQDRIDPNLFTDHVHLTKEGNEQLARFVWESWTGKGAS